MHDDAEDLLGEVLGVGRGHAVAAEPVADQRRVDVQQLLPGGGVGAVAQPFQEAPVRLRHERSSVRDTTGPRSAKPPQATFLPDRAA
jgi:hypothetical protein